jgi:hypothetical protein
LKAQKDRPASDTDQAADCSLAANEWAPLKRQPCKG